MRLSRQLTFPPIGDAPDTGGQRVRKTEGRLCGGPAKFARKGGFAKLERNQRLDFFDRRAI